MECPTCGSTSLSREDECFGEENDVVLSFVCNACGTEFDAAYQLPDAPAITVTYVPPETVLRQDAEEWADWRYDEEKIRCAHIIGGVQ